MNKKEIKYCSVCGTVIDRFRLRNPATKTCSAECTAVLNNKPPPAETVFSHCDVCGIAIGRFQSRCSYCQNLYLDVPEHYSYFNDPIELLN